MIIERTAQADGYRTLLVEAHENKSLAILLIPHLRRLLFELDRIADAGDKARRGLAVLKSFINGVKITFGDVEFGLDIAPEQGAADSANLLRKGMAYSPFPGEMAFTVPLFDEFMRRAMPEFEQ